jgi:two-component SAPR family response regulator
VQNASNDRATHARDSRFRFTVFNQGQPVTWHAESARELFFYLLANPEGQSRDAILEQLWQESPSASVSNRFRVTMHRIRTALGANDVVLEEHGRYRLSNEVLRASDLHAFYQALEDASHASTPKDRLLAFQRVMNVYQGDFLAGLNADWLLEAREEHRAAYVRAEIEVSLLHCEHGACESSVAALVRALRADPYLGENWHQKLMTCLSVVEGKYASVEHYRRFLHFLRVELEDSPMDETADLANRLKNGEVICQRKAGVIDVPETHSCALSSDGSCPGAFQHLISLN